MHKFKTRIYYEDTDAGGVVYHANYLKFTERGRTEMLRDLGLTNNVLREQENVILVVRKITADYLAPAFLEDEITVTTEVISKKSTRFDLRQVVLRDNAPLFEMTVTIVCVTQENGQLKACKLPPALDNVIKLDTT